MATGVFVMRMKLPPCVNGFTEGWLRGLRHWFAKPARAERSSVGSNPTSSAKNSVVKVYGGVCEWFMQTVLKTVVGETWPWVRILPPPPVKSFANEVRTTSGRPPSGHVTVAICSYPLRGGFGDVPRSSF